MTIFVAKLDFAPNDVIAKKVRRRGARGRRHWTRKKIGCCVSQLTVMINVVNSEIVFEMVDSYSSQLTWYIAHRRVAFFVGKSYLLLHENWKDTFQCQLLLRSCLLVTCASTQYNISTIRQFLGKYLPFSLHLLPHKLHFCLKSLWADILLQDNSKNCANLECDENFCLKLTKIANFR